jgi:hypothetical protein
MDQNRKRLSPSPTNNMRTSLRMLSRRKRRDCRVAVERMKTPGLAVYRKSRAGAHLYGAKLVQPCDTEGSMFLLLSLPSDILILIIDHLPVSDLVGLTSVCRKLYDLVSHSSPPIAPAYAPLGA